MESVVVEGGALSVVELGSAVADTLDVIMSVGVGTSDALVSLTSAEVMAVEVSGSTVVLSDISVVNPVSEDIVVSGTMVEILLVVGSDAVPKSVVDDSISVVRLGATLVTGVTSQFSETVTILVGASAVTVTTS